MDDYTNVIYDKETGKVLIFESNGQWIIPSSCDLAHFENGTEPVLVERGDGSLYLVPNAIILNNWTRDA